MNTHHVAKTVAEAVLEACKRQVEKCRSLENINVDVLVERSLRELEVGDELQPSDSGPAGAKATASASTPGGQDQPQRWICQSCQWNGGDAELLAAPNPFDTEDKIVGCPHCKAVNEIVSACDEPGCKRESSCGFPTPGGYRRTCGQHAHMR